MNVNWYTVRDYLEKLNMPLTKYSSSENIAHVTMKLYKNVL